METGNIAHDILLTIEPYAPEDKLEGTWARGIVDASRGFVTLTLDGCYERSVSPSSVSGRGSQTRAHLVHKKKLHGFLLLTMIMGTRED